MNGKRNIALGGTNRLIAVLFANDRMILAESVEELPQAVHSLEKIADEYE